MRLESHAYPKWVDISWPLGLVCGPVECYIDCGVHSRDLVDTPRDCTSVDKEEQSSHLPLDRRPRIGRLECEGTRRYGSDIVPRRE
jgi:hypothetical protein